MESQGMVGRVALDKNQVKSSKSTTKKVKVGGRWGSRLMGRVSGMTNNLFRKSKSVMHVVWMQGVSSKGVVVE